MERVRNAHLSNFNVVKKLTKIQRVENAYQNDGNAITIVTVKMERMNMIAVSIGSLAFIILYLHRANSSD